MQIMRWSHIVVLSVLLIGTLTACGGEADTNIGVFKAVPTDEISVGSGGGGNNLTVAADPGGALKFTLEEMTASAGTIKVTFDNPAAVAHNWTLVKPENADAAADEGAAAGPPDYRPADQMLVSPTAQTETVTKANTEAQFDIAEPGTYIYICTVPGHYAAGMKGTLTVSASK